MDVIWGYAIVFALAFLYVMFKESLSKKKMKTGEDKNALNEALAEVIEDIDRYTTLFAYYYKWKKKGGEKTTYYYHYAIAFNNSELLIIPVTYDKGLFEVGEPQRMEKTFLSQVVFNEEAETTEFLDQDEERILAYVSPAQTSNVKKNECPVAIDQTDEVKRYWEFMRNYSREVESQKLCGQ